MNNVSSKHKVDNSNCSPVHHGWVCAVTLNLAGVMHTSTSTSRSCMPAQHCNWPSQAFKLRCIDYWAKTIGRIRYELEWQSTSTENTAFQRCDVCIDASRIVEHWESKVRTDKVVVGKADERLFSGIV